MQIREFLRQHLAHVTWITMPVCVLALGALNSGCGAQAYQVAASNEAQQAPGNFSVPPKVDILLAEDDMGSAYGDYLEVAQQFPGFLNGIETAGWDYHFAAIPLTTVEPISQAFASKYDPNWGAQWQSPYPGAPEFITGPSGQQEFVPGSLSPSVFTIPNPNTNAGFLQQSQLKNTNDAVEPGFSTMWQALSQGAQGTGLIRSDALLVVMVIGDGDDTSLVNLCTRSDGVQGPCEQMGAPACTSGTAQSNYKPGWSVQNSNGSYNVCGTSQMSQTYYQQQFQSLKTATSQFQFFAAVAAERAQGCLGASNSFVGTRYESMAADTGGASYDICSLPISSVLSQLGANLQAVKLSYTTDYLFISQIPNVQTITVTKYLGGNTSQPVSIPESSTNGWTYAGPVTNVYTIDYPVPMNLASGIAIQLHGNAELVGADTASVTYTPAGAQNSVTN